MNEPQPREKPVFDPNASHHTMPKARGITGFPAKHGEQVMLGLADAQRISQRVVMTQPPVQAIIPLLDGTNGFDAIIEKVGKGLTPSILQDIVAQLDDAGLLEGPTFDAILQQMHDDYESLENLPPSTTADFAEALAGHKIGKDATDEQKQEQAPARLTEQFNEWVEQALRESENPSHDALPKAVVTPHLDYQRGWINYANVYGRMRVVERPDRIVVLGTNHFGRSTGICGCDKGFATPLGTCELDTDFMNVLKEKLGADNAAKLFQDRYDHEREHSIELQIPWVQYVFGADENGAHVPVFAALVHDPAVNNGASYDGNGLDLEPFTEALKASIAAAPGNTLVVCSADLSHVGPQFGDQQPLAAPQGDETEAQANAFREKVIKHDQELLQLFGQNKPGEMVASLAWQQNPTRWCSAGALAATLLASEPERIELHQYGGAMDQKGTGMVTSCSVSLF